MQVEKENVNVEETIEEKLETVEDGKKPTNWKKELLSWILTFVVAVAIALPVRAFVFEPIRVDGESMCDTLQDGEVMIVTKPEYLFGDPERGDVIICKYPERKENFVKRVMGVPGDVIAIESNVVYRNGEALNEPYLTPSRNDNGFSMAPFELGEDEYFVMGDNWNSSEDSRSNSVGVVELDEINGKIWLIVSPFVRINPVK